MLFNLSLAQLVILIPVFLFALTVHEFAHGYVAGLCGDPTARLQGRLTFNPMRHLDPIGTLAIFLMGFGWARPVPVDPRYFKKPKRDMVLVALAGPGANLLTMVASFLILLGLAMAGPAIPPFVGQPLTLMFTWSIYINSILAIFNLIPIPPLDGSKVLITILPPKQARMVASMEGYGFFIILILAFTGVLGKIISLGQHLLFNTLLAW
ncbi:MAG: site-2 protease family protein [Thermodesulfobacteriota bacterium]